MGGLSTLEIFVKVAETLNFAEAGKRLGLSPSAVGKSILRLEAQLETKLFNRSTRVVRLTAKGEQYLEYCRRALSELSEGERLLLEDSETPTGRLRIGMPLVCSPFQRTLLHFVRRYPGLQIELDFSDRLVDVLEEGFDLVVRTGQLTDSRLMARRLGSCKMQLLATPGYLDSAGHPKEVEDLVTHDCLRFRSSATGRLQRWPVSEKVEVSLKTRMTCSHVEMLYYAACDGMGIAYLPDFLTSKAVENGTLEVVLPRIVETDTEFNLVWPSSQWRPRKLGVAIEFLMEYLLTTAHDPSDG